MDRLGRASAAEGATVASCGASNSHPDVVDAIEMENGGGRPKPDIPRSQPSDSAKPAVPSVLTGARRGLFSVKGMDWWPSVAGCLSQPAVLESPDSDSPASIGSEVNGRESRSNIMGTSGISDEANFGTSVRRGGKSRRLWGYVIVLFLPNGTSHVYNYPVSVNAVLEEFSAVFPNHFVLEVCEDVAGRPSLESPRLPTVHNLSFTKVYALHPNKFRKNKHKRPNMREAFKGLDPSQPPRAQPTTSAEEDGRAEATGEASDESETAGVGRGKEDGRTPTENGMARAVIYEGVDIRRAIDVGVGPDVVHTNDVHADTVRVEKGEDSEKQLESGGGFSGGLGGCNGSGVQVADGSSELVESETSIKRSLWSARSALELSTLMRRSLSGSFQAADGGDVGVMSDPALFKLAGVVRVKSNQVADLSQTVIELDVQSLEGGSGKGKLSKWEPGLRPIKESRSWNSRKITPRHMRKVDRNGETAKMRLMKSRLKGKVAKVQAEVKLLDA